jgi:hypothetical protein
MINLLEELLIAIGITVTILYAIWIALEYNRHVD